MQIQRQILTAFALQLRDRLIGAMNACEVAEHGYVHVDLRWKHRAEIAAKTTNRHLSTPILNSTSIYTNAGETASRADRYVVYRFRYYRG
jgi:hypothetical protein